MKTPMIMPEKPLHPWQRSSNLTLPDGGNDLTMRRVRYLGAPPASATQPMVIPSKQQSVDEMMPAALERSARAKTNAMHSASVDATERAWASRPPLGADSLSNRASRTDGAMRTGPLSTRGAVPVGRPMTPERRMETFARRMWTRGDEAGAAQMQGQLARMELQREQQRSGQDFGREMNDVNFQQGLHMFGLHQQSQEAQEQRHHDRADRMWTRDQEAQKQREDQRWQNQLTLHQMGVDETTARDERMRSQEEADRKRVPNFGQVPIAGTDYAATYADGRFGGNVPMAKPDAPLPPGFAPRSAQRDGILYGPEDSGQPMELPKIYQGDRTHLDPKKRGDYYYEMDPQTRRPRKIFVDENNDGIDDRQQMGAGDQGSLSTRPAQAAGGASGPAKGGTTPQPPAAGSGRFGADISRLMIK